MKRLHILAASSALLVLVAAGPASAQVYPQADLNVVVGFPQGQFRSSVDNVGVGLSGFVGLGLGRAPVVIGTDLGFLIYGFERRSEPFSTTIPDVTVDVETSNSIFLGHLLLRIQPPTGPVRPYLDGLFGFKYFFTQTSIQNEGFRGDEPIATSTNFDDTALSYGAGGGVDVVLFRAGGSRRVTVRLNGGVRYLFGSEATYLQEGSIERRNGQVFFTTERSETHMLLTQLGVTVEF